MLLLPLFKSIIDTALLSYIHILYEIDLPFIHATDEYNGIKIVSNILKKCGAYFVNQKNLNLELYNIVLEELFGEMMKHNMILEYHMEKNR